MTSNNTPNAKATTDRKVSRARRVLATAAATAAIAGALALGTAGAAEASTNQFNNIYLSADNGASLMLDVSGGSTAPGAPVIQWYVNGGSNQKWNVSRLANGNSQIINVKSGQCLTTDGRPGDGLYQYPCVGAWSQEWNVGDMATNDFRGRVIINPVSGLYVDIYGSSRAAGATVDAWYGNGGDNQHFLAYQG